MRIIGICGKAKAGKDEMVVQYFKRPDHPLAQKHAFADAVKHSAAAFFGEPVGKFYENKDDISDQWGISYREMLQKLGTDFARNMIHEDFWVQTLDKKIRDIPPIIKLVFIPDVRFDNEVDWIHYKGGVVVECVREGHSSLAGTEAQHSSEDGISAHLIDYRILNDSSVEDLGAKLEKFIGTMTTLQVV